MYEIEFVGRSNYTLINVYLFFYHFYQTSSGFMFYVFLLMLHIN